MAYTKKYPGGWKNKPDPSTPLSAAAGDHMEEGIFQAAATADAAKAEVDGRLSEPNLTATIDAVAPGAVYTREIKSSPLPKRRLGAAVMASPPTISCSSTATLSKNILATDTRFRVSGAPQYLRSGSYSPKGSTKLDTAIDVFAGMWRRSFDFDGQAFEFRTTPGTDTRLLIWVDEQPHASAPVQLTSISGAVSGTPNWTKVDFGSRAQRRVTIEMEGDNAVNFTSMNIAPVDSLNPSSIPSSRLVWVGDSMGYGVGAGYTPTSFRDAFPIWASWEAGIDDVFNSTTQPSAGMVQRVGSTIGNHLERIGDMLPLAPDVLVIQGSINDGTEWPAHDAAIQTNTISYIQEVKAALPLCRIIVTGPIYAGEANTIHKAIGARMADAAAAEGVPYIDTVSVTEPVFTGTGAPHNLIGDGNADYYREANGVYTHPNREGHYYLAHWMAAKLMAILKLSN